MNKHILGLAVAFAISGPAFAVEEQAASFTESLQQGTAHTSLRYRYETVDQEGFTDDAELSAVRLRFNFKTQEYNNVSFFFEVDNLSEIWGTDYNSKRNGLTQFPVIADPLYTEMNQAYVSYTGINDTTIKYGRQRINLDNERFVGGVGWRQNEQTFDGVTIVNDSIKDLNIFYANIYNINTILGTNNSEGTNNILNVTYSGLPIGKITGYSYLLETMSDTYGVRLKGNQKVSGLKFAYEAEYATQETDDSASIDTDYYLLQASLGNKIFTGNFGYEVHTSDQGVSFQTPLGTNHAFNGWADKFLGVPADGLIDTFVGATVPAAGMKLKLIYHDFASEQGNTNYGTELDFVAIKKYSKTYSVMFKYASYSADHYSQDTDKIWVMFNANF